MFESLRQGQTAADSFTYTMADNRKATADFETVGNQTKLTVAFDAENENSEEMQRGGWQAILNNFKKYVESK